MGKPETYEVKTDWTHDNLMVCQSCKFFNDFLDEQGMESCSHPDHYWQGTYGDGPEWNGFCKQWEANS